MDMRQTILASFVSAACTAATVRLLDAALHSLRVPIDRAIAGQSQVYCCRKGYNAEAAGAKAACPRVIFMSAEGLAEKAPELLQRRSAAWAGAVHCFAFCIALSCVVLTALVVVRLDESTTRSWLLSSLFAVFTSWFQEPLKVSAKVAGLTLAAKLLSGRKEARRLVKAGTRVVQSLHRLPTGYGTAPNETLSVEQLRQVGARDEESAEGLGATASGEKHRSVFTIEAALVKIFNMGFVTVSKQWLEGAWATYDIDADGVLEEQEFAHLVAVLQRDYAPLNRDAAYAALTAKFSLEVSKEWFAGIWASLDEDMANHLEPAKFEELVAIVLRCNAS